MSTKNIYFASDFHLGLDSPIQSSKDREAKIVRWLESIIEDTAALYLVGDIFDFWFEYASVIPRGHTRFLAKLCEFTDAQIPVHFFSGNHDMWLFDYLQKEIGVVVHHKPLELKLGDQRLFIAHGDGLGPGDHGYKIIKWIFRNPINQWLFARIHPNTGIKIMRRVSRKSRGQEGDYKKFLGPNVEWLIQYCESVLAKKHHDFFIMGHRHLPISYTLSNKKSKYINLGDMISHDTYAVYDGQSVLIKTFEKDDTIIYGD